MSAPFKVGDKVGYKDHPEDPEFSVVGKVLEVYPNGIPSYDHPLVKVQGKSGVVLASHCTRIP